MRLNKGPERDYHKLAYYEFLDCRDIHKVSKRVKRSYISVLNWYHSFSWAERARLYDIEIQKKTELKLIDDKVKRNLKQIKDLEQIDNVLNLLYPSVFERDVKGNILNMDGEQVKKFGGAPALKLDLNSISDFERFVTTKVRVQDQIRKIQGEPDLTADTTVKVMSMEEAIKKYKKVLDTISVND